MGILSTRRYCQPGMRPSFYGKIYEIGLFLKMLLNEKDVKTWLYLLAVVRHSTFLSKYLTNNHFNINILNILRKAKLELQR